MKMQLKSVWVFVLSTILLGPTFAGNNYKIALVAKSQGNGFFEAAYQGAQDAARKLGNIKII